MPPPSYLLRRAGGRFQFQMRLGKELASRLDSSHLRFSLRTSDRRVAWRRLVDTLEWAIEFKEAPDLVEAGKVIVRHLERHVMALPRANPDIVGRRLFETYVVDFIRRSRERDFDYLSNVPKIAHLLRDFVAQNIALEDEEQKAKWSRPSLYVTGDGDSTAWRDQRRDEAPSMSPATEDLLKDVVRRLDALAQEREADASKAQVAEGEGSARKVVKESVPISVAVERFLSDEAKRNKSRKGDARFKPILDFMTAFLADVQLDSLAEQEMKLLDAALPEIPGLKGCPLKLRRDLHGRYLHGRETAWAGLQRVSTTTLTIRYRDPLRIFFKWAIKKELFSGPIPEFTAECGKVTAPLPRDRFQDQEILRFVSAPLFTGCDGSHRIWQSGGYLFQGDLYWAFLILLFTGMRTGEPPQIKLDDIVRAEYHDEVSDRRICIYFFDMRPYDPSQGRQSIENLKHLKRADFSRVIPIHPLLIDLGLLKRVEALRADGQTRLLPGIKVHRSGSDEVRWGKMISRAFSYARRLPNIDLNRANICLYSTRQLMADWLDSIRAPQRVRNRIMGHLNEENAADDYGGKGMMPRDQAVVITELETPIVKQMRTILMGAVLKAEAGQLAMLKTTYSRENGEVIAG